MSYQINIPFTFRNLPGLTLNAQLYSTLGATVGSLITTGFVDFGNGAYSHYATIPDGQVGAFLVWDASAPTRVIAIAINPQETENSDVKTSSRSTFSGGAVASVTGNVGGNVVGSVASVTAGVTVTTNNDKTGYGLSSAAIQAIWDALTSALTTSGSIGKLIVDNLNATITSVFNRLGAPSGASVSADIAAINAKTTNLPALPASTTNITAGAITTVTNLTNAPTAGDLTATMKASVTTAATAATPTAAAVTGSVGGNVVGSIGSLASQAKADVNTEADAALADVGVTTTITGRIDAAITSRLATAGYTTPPTTSQIVTAIMAYVLENGKTFLAAVLDMWSVTVGDSVADDDADPTSIAYDSPDGTVQVTHTLTDTTRTHS